MRRARAFNGGDCSNQAAAFGASFYRYNIVSPGVVFGFPIRF